MWTSQYITDEIIAQYDGHPRFKVVVDGTEEINENLLKDSVSLKLGCSDSSRFDVGGCVVGSLSFTIDDFEARFNGYFFNESTIDLYVGYGSSVDSAEYGEFGHFKVAEATRNQSIISITAYDALRDADKVEFVYNGNAATLTTNEIITIAAGLANITVGTLPSNTITVDTSTFTKITCRQAMQYALEASGNFAYINHLGQLTCRWFDFANPIKTFDDSFGSTFSENWTYTGVMVNGELTGTDGYVYSLSNNPFVNDSNKAAVAQRLYSILYDQGFYEASITVPLADPRIEPGDVVTVYEYGPMNTKTARIIPVTNITFKSELAETLSCSAASADTLDDLRQTETQKAENAVSPADVQDIIDQSVRGKYISRSRGSGEGTHLFSYDNEQTYPYTNDNPLISGYTDFLPFSWGNNNVWDETPNFRNSPRIHGGVDILSDSQSLEGITDQNVCSKFMARILSRGQSATIENKPYPLLQTGIYKQHKTSNNVEAGRASMIGYPYMAGHMLMPCPQSITLNDFVQNSQYPNIYESVTTITEAEVTSGVPNNWKYYNYIMPISVTQIETYSNTRLADIRRVVRSFQSPISIYQITNPTQKTFTIELHQFLDERALTYSGKTLAEINQSYANKHVRLLLLLSVYVPDPE